MRPLPRLIEAYERHGYQVRTGLNPRHFRGYKYSPFTSLHRDGECLATGGGIGLQDLHCFEYLFEDYSPPNIFLIGNGFGWSALALSMLSPRSKVVVIDAHVGGYHTTIGSQLTHDIAREESLDVVLIEATSPQDVPAVVSRHLDGRIDFAFIDGLHTTAQQELDYQAVRPFASPDCIYAFHDVVDDNMIAGFEKIRAESGLLGGILHRTPSGMGMLSPASTPKHVQKAIELFRDDDALVRSLQRTRKYRIDVVIWPLLSLYRKLAKTSPQASKTPSLVSSSNT